MTDTRPQPVSESIVPTDPVVTRLRHDLAQVTGGGVVLIALGAIAAFVTVLVMTLLVGLLIGWPGMGFVGWFVLVGVIFGGGAFAWLRKRPTLLAGRAFEYTDPRSESVGVCQYNGAMGVVGVGLDGLFIGPRMLEAGIRQGAGKEPASRERFFDRCALLLRQLARAGEQVKTDRVRIGEDETDDKLKPVLDYLDRGGWLGMSSDRTRLWLSSKAKLELPALGVPLGMPGGE